MRSRAAMTGMVATMLAIPFGISASVAAAAPQVPGQAGREVRTTWTNEFGAARPAAVTYVPEKGELLVAEPEATATDVVRLDFDEQSTGSLQLPPVADPTTVAYDPNADELTAVNDGQVVIADGSDITTKLPSTRRSGIGYLSLQDAQGSSFDPVTGNWYLLDARGGNIVRVTGRETAKRTVTKIPLSALGQANLRGLAFNSSDGLLYVGSPDEKAVYAVDQKGAPKKKYDLSALGLRGQGGMTFAPSADTTDPAGNQNLFIAQSGDAQNLGGVTEVTLAAAAAPAVPTVNATLVQTIATSGFNPSSPDPSGIAYLSGSDRMQIVDSEVDETTGAGYHGVNMWQFTRQGAMTATGTTFPRYSKEPTGVAYDAGSNTMFISDDSARRIHIVKPGPDGKFGNADDVVTFINAGALGSSDTEDPAFDPVSGDLFFSDAVSTEIYRVDPVNGVFGDGNDTVTHFDVGVLGPTDTEGLAYYPADNTLLVGDRTTRKIYEITRLGTLQRIINAKVGDYSVLSGLTVAPAVSNSGRQDFWIASRGIDNGPQPNENDGKVVEVSIGGPVDAPPTVSVTAPAEGATVSGANVSVQATATDDKGVTQVQFFDGSTSLGTDTNAADGWSATWNTTAATNGGHVIRAVATDTIGQTASDTNNVTVNNVVDAPPSVSVTAPAEGATVSGANVSVTANASDDKGVTQVQFFDGSTSLGTDTNGTDGWSVTWNTTAATDGGHVIRATATDTANQTGTDTNNVTVDNSPPTVSITSPADGATVSGTTSIVTNANDAQGLASVTFLLDGSTVIGTDTNGADGWSLSWNTVGAGNGPHSLTARATNGAGAETTSAPVSVTVSNTGATISVDIPIAAGGDDIEERTSDGRIDTASTDLDLLLDNDVPQTAAGLRFAGVAIPHGAAVANAYVQFKADETSAEPTDLTINGIATDNASAFTTAKFSLSGAARTGAFASWSPVAWTAREQTVAQRTPNLAPVLQQIFDRSGWASGNALALVITGSGHRVAKSFEGTAPPVLHVEYTLG